MKEKTIVSTVTLIASMASYLYAKNTGKDTVPFVMIGGFVGVMVGEVIAKAFPDDDNTPHTA